jgi:hypothetical protein
LGRFSRNFPEKIRPGAVVRTHPRIKVMNPTCRYTVRAIISNGTELTFHSDSIMSVGAWKEGVSNTAALFSESVQFIFTENEVARFMEIY